MYKQTYRMQAATAHPPQQAPARYARFRVRPISGALGAEVLGADLKDCDGATFAELEAALTDHLVLFVRDQALAPEDEIALAKRFGPPMPWPYAAPLEGYPEITELRSEPGDQYNFGGSWHQDSLNFERPPKITMLYGVECPEVGGDTSFANQYLAWDTLPEELKTELAGMTAINSAAKSYAGQAGSETVRSQTATPLTFELDQENEVDHPVAPTHPATGRRALYVNDAFTARFGGRSEADSLPLLERLWAHAITPEFTCRFRWRPGTLAIWDNRCTMHYAHNDYAGCRRVMWRIAIEGERPV